MKQYITQPKVTQKTTKIKMIKFLKITMKSEKFKKIKFLKNLKNNVLIELKVRENLCFVIEGFKVFKDIKMSFIQSKIKKRTQNK